MAAFMRSVRWYRALAALAVVCLVAMPVPCLADEPPATGSDSPPETPRAFVPTHEQTKYIMPTQGNARWKLASFCVLADGNLAALVTPQEGRIASKRSPGIVEAVLAALGRSSNDADQSSSSAGPSDAVAEVRILDADGKLLRTWPLDFQAQAVNAGPDGSIVIGGDGVLVRLDAAGKQLARAQSPQVATLREDPEGLKRRARETLEEQRSAMKDALKQFEQQKAELEKKQDSELSDDERQMKGQIDQILASYKRQAEKSASPITDQEVEQMAESLAQQGRTINAIAANDQFVFVTTRAAKGYGFRVWRTKLDFSEPEAIADGLSGCCGQMDVQCCGDEIVVAENSRKRLVRYGADGKKVDSWGKSSRDGEGDTFGSCCNPMNTRFAGGKLYVSDSDGRVRLFTLDGTYEAEVGKANVEPGCKSSIVDVSPDGNRVYYIDVHHSRICLLERKADNRQAAR